MPLKITKKPMSALSKFWDPVVDVHVVAVAGRQRARGVGALESEPADGHRGDLPDRPGGLRVAGDRRRVALRCSGRRLVAEHRHRDRLPEEGGPLVVQVLDVSSGVVREAVARLDVAVLVGRARGAGVRRVAVLDQLGRRVEAARAVDGAIVTRSQPTRIACSDRCVIRLPRSTRSSTISRACWACIQRRLMPVLGESDRDRPRRERWTGGDLSPADHPRAQITHCLRGLSVLHRRFTSHRHAVLASDECTEPDGRVGPDVVGDSEPTESQVTVSVPGFECGMFAVRSDSASASASCSCRRSRQKTCRRPWLR